MSKNNYYINLKIPPNQIFNASELIDFKTNRSNINKLVELKYIKPEPFIVTHDLICIKIPVKEEFFSHNKMEVLLKEFFYIIKDLVKGRLYYEFEYFHPDENVFKSFVVSNYNTLTEYRCEWDLISSTNIDSSYEYYPHNTLWDSFQNKIISLTTKYANLTKDTEVKKVYMLATSDERRPHPTFVSKTLDTWHIEILKINHKPVREIII